MLCTASPRVAPIPIYHELFRRGTDAAPGVGVAAYTFMGDVVSARAAVGLWKVTPTPCSVYLKLMTLPWSDRVSSIWTGAG